jgi:hypothetical protein
VYREPLALTYGDTIIRPLPLAEVDVFTTHRSRAAYAWAIHDPDTGRIVDLTKSRERRLSKDAAVVSGFFSIANPSELVRAITICRGDFIEALNVYNKNAGPLRPLHELGTWFDLGHLQTFYQSHSHFTTERSFNALKIGRRTVIKRSQDRFKMCAEADWFCNISPQLRPFCPQFVQRFETADSAGYELAFEHLMTLSDMFVFGAHDLIVWGEVFEACDEFLSICRQAACDLGRGEDVDDLLFKKTAERLKLFARDRDVHVDKEFRFDGRMVPSPMEIARQSYELVRKGEIVPSLMHGDFCFSNIFYDFHKRMIKVIDPRGYVRRGTPTVFGDLRYDLAKLHHSVVGKYDLIIAGFAKGAWDGSRALSFRMPVREADRAIEDAFFAQRFAGVDPKGADLLALSVMLFFSMLPLHSDRPDRQTAMLANALRLWTQIEAEPL